MFLLSRPTPQGQSQVWVSLSEDVLLLFFVDIKQNSGKFQERACADIRKKKKKRKKNDPDFSLA